MDIVTPNQLQPLPDREAFEWQIREVFDDGDIEASARYLQFGRTNLSKMLNPGNCDRHNPFWLTAAILWTFDAKGTDQADQLLGIIRRHRSMWLPAPVAVSDPAKSTSRIGRELMDLMEKEFEGVCDDQLLKECQDIEDAVKAKVNEILSRRRLAGTAR